MNLVTVPNLVGLPVAGARQALNAKNLVLGEVSGEGDEAPGRCDVIDSQYPAAGREVPRGSAVNVYLKTVLVVVPDLVGKSVPRARELLKPNLVLGEVSGEGDVIDSQVPVAGKKVPCGSAVNVYRKTVYVVVPDLVGKSVPRATELLKPDLVLRVRSEVPGKCDVIDSQAPIAGTKVPRGSTVHVYLKTVLVPVPNLVSRTVEKARVVLTAAGLVLRNGPAGDSRVESQAPAAETLVCPGSAVTVTVSMPPDVPPPPVVPPPVVPPPVVLPVVPPPPVMSPPVAQPSVSQPEPSVVPAPVAPAALGRWLWPVGATLALLILLVAGLLVSRAIRAPQEQKQKQVHPDVRAVVGAVSGVEVEVISSRPDHSPPTCIVRIEPHADSGTQVLEEVHQ